MAMRQSIPTPTISELRKSAKEDREKRIRDRTIPVEDYKKKQVLNKDQNDQNVMTTPMKGESRNHDTYERFVVTADHPTDEINIDKSANSSQGQFIFEQD